MNRIFVNIASYRDAELIPTIRDAIEKARNPERVSFGVCWQHGPEEPKTFDEDNDELYSKALALNYARYDHRDSLGMGWARKISQSFWRGEEFQLQIDSHMRFAKDWDWHLLNLQTRCNTKYNTNRAILSSRTLPYYPEKEGDSQLRKGIGTYLHASKFRDNGVLILTSGGMRKKQNFRDPVPGAFISGHYMFSPSRLLEEMPYDDKFAVISTGDEPILSVKAFTRGWDIFYPHKVIIWHHFFRYDATKNHNDHKGQTDRQSWKTMAHDGVKQFNDIVSGKIPIGSRYGLGRERTIDDYKNYCGVDYKKKKHDKKLVFVDGVFRKEKEGEKTSRATPKPKEVNVNTNDGKGKIFVQIASYRDPDILNTIRDAVETAENPDKLIFGICDQYGPENKHLHYYDKENFRVMRVPFYASSGLGWARHMIQKLYFEGDAEYTMQLDSHMRFASRWDTKLKDMLHKTGAEKPIITHYCTPFTFSQKEKEYLQRTELFKMYCLRFNKGGTISFRQTHVKDKERDGSPGKSMWVSGHFFFTLASHIKEYPYDPNLYFAGDEISLAVRSWTNGWDIFHPSENVVFHNYTREERICHWSDQKVVYSKLHEQSWEKLRQMLGMEDNGIDMGVYGLGEERSLKDYQKISGIDFKKRELYDAAKKGNPIF